MFHIVKIHEIKLHFDGLYTVGVYSVFMQFMAIFLLALRKTDKKKANSDTTIGFLYVKSLLIA
ncbi:hypothetical protein [Colwellia marinimaniae]|uniref:hypothetical protein n=1 Tax=Colwellia marinimaniae TaxID=1513592 RepID=UPI00117C52CA|nr:hypothetical protein [Colwellia marinimaniae]